MKAGSFLSLTFIFMIIMAPIAFASSITNYTYDPNGNMVSDGEFNYTYNAANQMVMAIEADTGDFVEEYLYDHSGNRVKKIESTDSGNKTTYYVSGLYEITVNPDGSTTNTTYVYANGERVARNETNENGSTVFYYHSDHLQSTSVVTTQGNLMANLTEADSTWTTIQLNKSLSRPVVIAKITSENETDNSDVRITNTSSNSFIIKIEETTAFDGNHGNETVSYIALEEGTIANGAEDIGEAGTVESGPIWTRVTFQEAFSEVPVVIASPMTQNDATAGVARVRNIYKTGFDVRFEEYGGGDHPLETIGWMAVKQGTHTLDGKMIVAGSASVNSNYSSVSLSGFSNTPAVITQIQSHGESDYGSHTRVANASLIGFEIKIEENNDTTHATETIGYIAIEPTVLKSGSAKVEETKYYPYGVIQEGGNEKYLYTGKEKDAGTGLYYYEARYYNSRIGRFIQADTITSNVYNPQNLNRYSYVLNNPLRYVDPSGHVWVETERETTNQEKNLWRFSVALSLLIAPQFTIGESKGFAAFNTINKISAGGGVASSGYSYVTDANQEQADTYETFSNVVKGVVTTGVYVSDEIVTGQGNLDTAKDVGKTAGRFYSLAALIDVLSWNKLAEMTIDKFGIPQTTTERTLIHDYGSARSDIDYSKTYSFNPYYYNIRTTQDIVGSPVTYSNGGGGSSYNKPPELPSQDGGGSENDFPDWFDPFPW